MQPSPDLIGKVAPYWVAYGALGLYFLWGRDAETKARLWPLYLIGLAGLFLWFGWQFEIVQRAGWLLVPLVLLMVITNWRSLQFCRKCGATVRSGAFINRAKHCHKCGAALIEE
jgi:hypothetical protein